MKQYLVPIIRRELLLLLYNINLIVLSIISALVTFFIFFIVLDKQMFANSSLLYSLILITTILTITLSDYLSIADDYSNGIMEQLFLLPIKPVYILLIKLLLGLFKYLIIHTALWYILWTNIATEPFLSFFFINYLIFIIYLISVSMFVKTISLSTNGNVLQNLLLILLIFPQLILSILSIQEPLYLLLQLSLTILMLPLFILFSTIIMQRTIQDS